MDDGQEEQTSTQGQNEPQKAVKHKQTIPSHKLRRRHNVHTKHTNTKQHYKRQSRNELVQCPIQRPTLLLDSPGHCKCASTGGFDESDKHQLQHAGIPSTI